MQEDFSKKMGLASFLVVECDTCSHVSETYTSPKCTDSRAFVINRSAVLGMLEIGAGKTGYIGDGDSKSFSAIHRADPYT